MVRLKATLSIRLRGFLGFVQLAVVACYTMLGFVLRVLTLSLYLVWLEIVSPEFLPAILCCSKDIPEPQGLNKDLKKSHLQRHRHGRRFPCVNDSDVIYEQ